MHNIISSSAHTPRFEPAQVPISKCNLATAPTSLASLSVLSELKTPSITTSPEPTVASTTNKAADHRNFKEAVAVFGQDLINNAGRIIGFATSALAGTISLKALLPLLAEPTLNSIQLVLLLAPTFLAGSLVAGAAARGMAHNAVGFRELIKDFPEFIKGALRERGITRCCFLIFGTATFAAATAFYIPISYANSAIRNLGIGLMKLVGAEPKLEQLD